MEELPREEVFRLEELSIVDEQRRDRKQFKYGFDILKRNWAYRFSIWPMPNEDVLQIINGKIGLDDVPFEDLNEFHKGMLFQELSHFIFEHIAKGKEILCEARDYSPCLKGACPLFRDEVDKTGEKLYLCSEFKIAFIKDEVRKEKGGENDRTIFKTA